MLTAAWNCSLSLKKSCSILHLSNDFETDYLILDPPKPTKKPSM